MSDEIMDVNDYSLIPSHMMDALTRYIENKIKPGGFLTAVLCNNLKLAVGQADYINIKIIPVYVSFLYNNAPANCWGSVENFENYLRNED